MAVGHCTEMHELLGTFKQGGFKSLVLWAVLGKDTSYGMLEGRQGSGCDASSGSVKLQWSLYHHSTG